jgi:hypothetical protein
MRKICTLLTSLLLFASAATISSAGILEWEGTLRVEMLGVAEVIVTGTGVATVNGSSGTGHMQALGLAGGIADTVVIPLTDPLTPTFTNLTVTAALGTGTLASNFASGPLTQNTLPVPGNAKICVLFLGVPCGLRIDVPLTTNQTAGVGIGGTVTAPTLSVQLRGGPWTVATASVTTNAATYTTSGFVHGPVSGTSSTALPGGVVQLVTPAYITSSLGAEFAVFTELTLLFVPEPDRLMLLGPGLALLLLLGHRRMRR